VRRFGGTGADATGNAQRGTVRIFRTGITIAWQVGLSGLVTLQRGSRLHSNDFTMLKILIVPQAIAALSSPHSVHSLRGSNDTSTVVGLLVGDVRPSHDV
jgi:hypothetical protein